MAYKVWIVDDEEIVCRGLAQFVKWQEHGFVVAGIANSVDEALLQLEHAEADVIFLDIRMPGKTGLDMLQILRKSRPGVKTVILSGFSEFSYAREAIRYGAVDYLTKPVNLKEVEALLERLKEEFEKEDREQEIRDNRIEGLLISVVKGVAEVEQENTSCRSWSNGTVFPPDYWIMRYRTRSLLKKRGASKKYQGSGSRFLYFRSGCIRSVCDCALQ